MSSPWIYLALFLLAATDAFLPAVPSESVVITAGVFAAASGSPNLALVVLAAAAGAFAGDHISYAIGRGAGGRLLARARPGSRQRRAFDRAADALAERGGLVLVVARYVPGGRTAVTVTMGALGYPRRRFTHFDVLAALSWAVYSVLVGYVGGMAFENDPIKGVVLGVGLALGVTALVEAGRYVRRRRVRDTEGRGEALVPAAGRESARTP
nr:DedA family protein [Actinopolymorpha rutila]